MRRRDWECALGAYLASCAGARFRYGRMDCALFAAGAVMAMTGNDPAAPFRGKYRSQAGSIREIRRAGYDSLIALMDAQFEAIPPAFARRGDLVADTAGSLGVCVGRDALFVGEEEGAAGLVRLPLTGWAHAWRIPFGA